MHHCHNCLGNIPIPEGARKIVLAGNPNVGKSVFFNALTGMYVDVSNFPGTTVDISHGRYGRDIVLDTPGVYGISSFNDEEIVARDVILSADLILNVVDAVHLERDLFLTLQVIDTGIPTIVAVNMTDEAAQQGLKVDIDLLEHLLGVPVIPTVAVKGQGVEEVKKRLFEARTGNIPPDLKKELESMLNRIGSWAEALLVLEGDPHVAERHGIEPGDKREEIYHQRRDRVNDIIGHTVAETNEGTSFRTKLGRYMLRPITGVPIFVFVLYLMYYLIGVIVAQDIVGFTEENVMQGMYEPAIRSLIGAFISEESVLGTILIGEFGLLTLTVTYILGLLLPLVVGFYFALSIMEDSGYLPRLATLVDRVMTSIGLNGRAIIPVILGFGCVTMATITTRILGTKRERTIATAVLGLAIPCSAQLGVIAGMLAGIGPQYIAVYIVVMLAVLGLVGKILNKVLPGESSDLLIDLPPIRLPRGENVLKKTVTKSYAFLLEATPLFMLGALIISVLQISGLLEGIQLALAPLTEGILYLPRETATAFIMGMIRRDFGAAGLSDMDLTPAQTLVSLVTITLFVPCIASVIVMLKERGTKEGALIWVSSWIFAFVIGGIVARIVM
ncbi:MAG TPA: ferrous iron transport protein B [Methylomusa anaerophila]|uniref:Ferrous iron transport protein B n=1 Tax=Methylomusa anaerophila TaxID=1930071 RepID=A0A348AIW3_9FIRM|nr:ferrous iron transport protein B [Methylomusa anaerophila]BBB91011.1 ferrous iron transport protein B [Methylomusa anaerophila]HML88882.1 ferrous iron transport protein B [Methylomusa anaerophila]